MFPVADSIAHRYAPFVVWSLVAANAIIFFAVEAPLAPPQLEALISAYGLIPARYMVAGWAEAAGLSANNFTPFLSDQFLHGGLFHLLANMWALWIFGPSVEDRLGGWRFLIFFLAAGVAANITHVLLHPASQTPIIGASGAIAGVLGAYTVMFPRAQLIVMIPVLFFPFFFNIPAFVFTGIWFASQFFMGIAELSAPAVNMAGGIAFWAHVGGFVFGVLAALTWRAAPRHDRRRFADEGYFGHPAH